MISPPGAVVVINTAAGEITVLVTRVRRPCPVYAVFLVLNHSFELFPVKLIMFLDVFVDLVQRELLRLCLCFLVDLVFDTSVDEFLSRDLPPLPEVLLLHVEMVLATLESRWSTGNRRQRSTSSAFCVPLVDGSPDDVIAW